MPMASKSVAHRRSAVSVGEVVTAIGSHGVMIVVCICAILPFVWMAFGSFKTVKEITSIRNPSYWWPREPTLLAYDQILYRAGFPDAIRNSTLVAVPNTLMVCFTSAAMGYVFSKYRFPGRDLIFTALLSTMMVPFAVVMLPLYVTLHDFGLLNSLWALIVLGVCSTFGIFLMRQSMEGIPNDYIDAARIDGASEWWIFASVIVPLARAPLSALAIFTFLGSWDNFMFPSIIITDMRWQTLPIFLVGLKDLWNVRYNIYCAGSMLTVIPMMIVYSVLQRHFIRGLTMTGLKG